MNDAAIEVIGLVKSYKSQRAVDGLSFTVPRGSICGFLGRNGAGKTTTIKTMLGMLKPDAGTASVLGMNALDPDASVLVRQQTGFVSEIKEFYPYMNVGQTIDFTKPFYPTWDRALEKEFMDRFSLSPKQKVTKLSKGMRTQLAILLAVARNTDLLIMDEPTDGLDPFLVEETLRLLVGHAARRGTTIFFSSHQLDEVEQIADRVIIIDRGKVKVEGSLDDLRSNYRRVRMVFQQGTPAEMAELVGAASNTTGRTVSILARDNVDHLVDRARSHHATDIEVQAVGLKEIFLEVVKQ